MKEGYIADTGSVPTEKELEQINSLSRRNLSADEVFVFSVVLCDNEIDRDFERFTVDALNKMASLYIGKTGIFDHSMKGRDQVARIFSCEVERPAGQTTSYSEPYVRVKARAYMPKTDKNRDLMTEIDAGIKKEVSVGCAMEQVTCSVCGADVRHRPCEHQKGKTYHLAGKDVVCHHVLNRPTDAYEWSFVAVPAQRSAGVVKHFFQTHRGGGSTPPADILKALKTSGQVVLTPEDAGQLSRFIEGLQKQADAGYQYTLQKAAEVVRLGGLLYPQTHRELLVKMAGALDFEELCKLEKDFTRELNRMMPVARQLPADDQPETPKETNVGFHNFMI